MSSATRSLPAIVLLLAFVLVACGTATSPGSVAPEVHATPVAPSMPPAAVSAPPVAATSAPGEDATTTDSWLVVGQTGEPGTRVILASTGEILYRLPDGVPDATWGRMLAATVKGSQTMVQDLAVQPGFGGPVEMIEGRWRLPRIGADPTPVGTSADGRIAVLVEDGTATDGAPARSRFAIITVPFAPGWPATAPRIVELAGSFEFDTLSPDGSTLYVVEHLAGPPSGHYQVRAVDVATGRLRPEVVVDKTGGDEAMAGYPIAQLRRADGMVFTLYRGNEHPFIHALASADSWALCIDLPTSPVSPASDQPRPEHARLGHGQPARRPVVPGGQCDPGARSPNPERSHDRTRGTRSIRSRPARSRSPSSATTRPSARDDGSSSPRTGLRPMPPGSNGIVRLRPDDLSVLGHLLPGVAVTTLAVTPDRTRLFALTADGRILEVDLASGSIVRSVSDGGFDRLFAVVPW